uniref:1,4-dihydroxy-2-naphthoate octaprenyltransferase n=1 Tax=uncultured Thermoplasmata archaeon TaxID=376542 RepID=A0A871YCF0_9ARCH|nr:UbiA family prenyltransferase [uncultured Thermoplasmata archaeon]
MTSKIKGLKHIIYDLSRINEWWLISAGFVLFAFLPYTFMHHGRVLDIEMFRILFTDPAVYIALLIVFSAQIFLFASNDYFDRDVDALDPGKRVRNPVCDGRVTLAGVRALLIVTAIIPLIASLYFGLLAFLFSALAMFIFYYYTAPPLRFKNKVFLDVLSHGLFVNTFPYFFCLVALMDFTVGTVFLLFAIMMRSTMAQMLQEIRDYHIDSQVEKNTVVVLGQKRAIWVVFSVYIVLFTVTTCLMLSYELFGWGIPMYYSIILILAISYIPIFRKLLKAKDYNREIERLWMGQGRTNRWQVAQYFASFSIYFILVIFLIITGYS